MEFREWCFMMLVVVGFVVLPVTLYFTWRILKSYFHFADLSSLLSHSGFQEFPISNPEISPGGDFEESSIKRNAAIVNSDVSADTIVKIHTGQYTKPLTIVHHIKEPSLFEHWDRTYSRD